MNRPTFTIQVPGYQPVTVTLEPSAALTPPTAPPEGADAAGASGAGKAGKRGGMSNAERQRKWRQSHRCVTPRVTETVTETVTQTVTPVTETVTGGVGGGVFDSDASMVGRPENKAQTQIQHQNTPPLARNGRNGSNVTGVTEVTESQSDNMTKPVTNADIIAAWPESAGGGISNYHVNEATRAICINQACSAEVARAFLLKRIQSYKAGSWVETTEPKFRASWKTWLKEDALGPQMPGKWFQRNPAATPSNIGKGRGDGWGGDAAKRAMEVKS